MTDSLIHISAGQSTRLDRTLKDLQDMVKEQEAILEEVRGSYYDIRL